MSATTITRPAVRWHGGKWRLAPWIIGFFPDHETYIEPFGGAASVLLQKKRSKHEVYNDLDSNIVHFFKVLRDKNKCTELVRQMELTPFSRDEFDSAFACELPDIQDDVERARLFLVRASMGFSSDAASRLSKTGFRCHRDAVNLYEKGFSYLYSIADRFNGVCIENTDAFALISRYNTDGTLIYLDPPYLKETRNNSNGGYAHELSDDGHISLFNIISGFKGFVVLSGYDSDLYTSYEEELGLIKFSTEVIAQGQLGNAKRTECLWINQRTHEFLSKQQLSFF